MQNNVTYLSRKLQRSLDNNYNVIDMPAVIEIISTLEKTSVTKELLETTRLGKYINELRRKTSNESLAKRAKELLKKWRDLILPDANGQIRPASVNLEQPRSDSPTPKNHHSKKRPASSTPPASTKKLLVNGAASREYDFSDNSNCSVKEYKKTDVIFINSDSNSSMPESLNQGDHFDVSNDATTTDGAAGAAASMQPKKRGRKKGSKNHKNLVIAAEESFTNKMAVSRNSKVKTTQELLADIQNRKPSTQDIELRTAQLTESLSRIEHKLNLQKTINKNVTSIKQVSPEPIASDDEIVDVVGTDTPVKQEELPQIKHEFIESAPKVLPLTIENLLKQLPVVDKSCLEEPPEIPLCECPTPKVTELKQIIEQQQQQQQITVQILGGQSPATTTTSTTTPTTTTTNAKESLFAPPSPSPTPFFSDTAPCLDIDDERTSDSVVDNSDKYEENLLCPAKLFLSDKYHLDSVDDCKVSELHEKFIPNVNGIFGAPQSQHPHDQQQQQQHQHQQQIIDGNVENIVPNFMSERLNKTPNENFQKYSISISETTATPSNSCDSDSEKFRTNTADADVLVAPSETSNRDFREWHETLDVISYNDELLRILPYVIID